MCTQIPRDCPCGYFGDTEHPCDCGAGEIRRYLRKISGPLLDRIDLHVGVTRPRYAELVSADTEEPSATIRERVMAARARQAERLARYGIATNSQMGHRHLRSTCHLTPAANALLERVFSRLHLSARTYDRLIKVACTIADLDGEDVIGETQIAEAVSYRSQDQ